MANEPLNSTNNNTENNPLGDRRNRRNRRSNEDDGTSAFKKFSAAVDRFATAVSGTTGDVNTPNTSGVLGGALGEKIFSRMGDFGDMFQDMSESMNETSSSSGGTMIALQIVNKVLEAIRSTLGFISDTIQKGIDSSISNQKQYLGPISARLQSFNQDSAESYKTLSYEIRNVFTNSRYVNQQTMLENLSKLVEAGVGYNLEDRAYLATIMKRTVETFDVLDASLNRMIRLQQADLTRPQMGLEAYLTQGLNAVFQDTSYLSNMYDTVTSALVEATSQMAYNETTSYLYNVQKWLGSLYSVGISESAINTIAQGLNYLGSGNVNQLTSNNQLNTLFAMSAQKAGLSYAQLLTTGVSDENVDKLLRSMIEYLQSIAENTSSEVLRSEYGRIFGGFSVSDLRAIQNLTSTDISYIDAYKLDYQSAFKEVQNQISKLDERTSTAEKIENMFNNLIYSIGAQVAENETLYKNWVLMGILEEAGDTIGGIIPGVIGEIFSNGIGAAAEAIKIGDVLVAINGVEGYKGLDMFKNYEYEQVSDLIDEKTQYAVDMYNYAKSDEGTAADMLYAGQQMQGAIVAQKTKNTYAIKAGIANWDPYSFAGGGYSDTMFGDWQQGTSRLNNYSFSIASNENAFAESEAKIKAASEEITGVDDTVAQSLDDIYDGLFGTSSRPIKVMIVDIDGNLLNTTTTTDYASNFDLEENIGAQIFKLMPNVKGAE